MSCEYKPCSFALCQLTPLTRCPLLRCSNPHEGTRTGGMALHKQ